MTQEEIEAKIKGFKGDIALIFSDGSHYQIKITDAAVMLRNGRMELYDSNQGGFEINRIKDIILNPKSIDSYATLGSDPEFFFTKDGEVVPSNDVLRGSGSKVVVPDGFQGELNPTSHTCRVSSGAHIAIAIKEAETYAEQRGVQLDFSVGHVIGDTPWKKASLTTKRFGCHPTENVYQSKFKRITGLRERFRAAGGHIHFGGISDGAKKDLDTLVKVMDIVVGNTFVLIDRDPNNARRRINYGRAGEYRPKSYGLEYRVLSNFWLKSYTLWSFAAGLMRNAYGIYKENLAGKLIESFEMSKVCEAINNNDYDLALENFQILKAFFKEHNLVSSTALSVHNIDRVEKFLTAGTVTRDLGITTTSGILSGWATFRSTYSNGFERFIQDNYKD